MQYTAISIYLKLIHITLVYFKVYRTKVKCLMCTSFITVIFRKTSLSSSFTSLTCCCCCSSFSIKNSLFICSFGSLNSSCTWFYANSIHQFEKNIFPSLKQITAMFTPISITTRPLKNVLGTNFHTDWLKLSLLFCVKPLTHFSSEVLFVRSS